MLNSFLKYSDRILVFFAFFNLLFILDFLLPSQHSFEKLNNLETNILKSRSSSYVSSMDLFFEYNEMTIYPEVYLKNYDFFMECISNKNVVFDVEVSSIFGIVEMASHKGVIVKRNFNVLACLSVFAILFILINAFNLFVLKDPSTKIYFFAFIMFITIMFNLVIFIGN